MSEAAIMQLLSSAEQCHERGRHRMAKLTLSEIWTYLDSGTEIDDETFERIQALDDKYGDDEDYVAAAVPDKPGGRCGKCDGSGKYKANGRTCFACKGKGHQDEADIVRNQSYWANRDRLRELRRSSAANDL